MKTIIEANEKSAADEMAAFLKTLTPDEQQEIRIFIQGAMFMRKAGEKEKRSA